MPIPFLGKKDHNICLGCVFIRFYFFVIRSTCSWKSDSDRKRPTNSSRNLRSGRLEPQWKPGYHDPSRRLHRIHFPWRNHTATPTNDSERRLCSCKSLEFEFSKLTIILFVFVQEVPPGVVRVRCTYSFTAENKVRLIADNFDKAISADSFYTLRIPGF